MSASTAAGYVGAIVQNYSVRATARLLAERGLGGFRMPVEAATRVWYNPELRSANFLVPGLMAFILMVIVVISTAFSVVREKERGTMEQIAVSPLQPFELIAGKTIPYVLLSLVSSHSVLLLGYVLFGVSVRGSYLLLLLTMTIFLVGGLGPGPPHLDDHPDPAGRFPAGHPVHVPPHVHPVRVHLPGAEHAPPRPGDHHPHPGPILPQRPPGHRPQRGGAPRGLGGPSLPGRFRRPDAGREHAPDEGLGRGRGRGGTPAAGRRPR